MVLLFVLSSLPEIQSADPAYEDISDSFISTLADRNLSDRQRIDALDELIQEVGRGVLDSSRIVSELLKLISDPTESRELSLQALIGLNKYTLDSASHAASVLVMIQSNSTLIEFRIPLLDRLFTDLPETEGLIQSLLNIFQDQEESRSFRIHLAEFFREHDFKTNLLQPSYLRIFLDQNEADILKRLALDYLEQSGPLPVAMFDELNALILNVDTPMEFRRGAVRLVVKSGSMDANGFQPLLALVSSINNADLSEVLLREVVLVLKNQIQLPSEVLLKLLGMTLEINPSQGITLELLSELFKYYTGEIADLCRQTDPAVLKLEEAPPFDSVLGIVSQWLTEPDLQDALGELGLKWIAETGVKNPYVILIFTEILTEKGPLFLRRDALNYMLGEDNWAENQEKVDSIYLQLAKDVTEDSEIRSRAVSGICRTTSNLYRKPQELEWEPLKLALVELRKRQELIQSLSGLSHTLNEQDVLNFDRVCRGFEKEHQSRWLERISQWNQRHVFFTSPWTLIGFVLIVTHLLFRLWWWGVLQSTPFRIWELDRKLGRWDLRFPLLFKEKRFGVRHLIGLPSWKYHPIVLDEWVKRCSGAVLKYYQGDALIVGRGDYTPAPIEWNENRIPRPDSDLFKRLMNDSTGVFVIFGQPGVGRKSLAVRLVFDGLVDDAHERFCKERFIPVVIEESVFHSGRMKKRKLLDIVKEQLKEMVGPEEPISEDHVIRLLNGRRLMLLLSDIDTWNPVILKQVKEAVAKFPENCRMAVTCRRVDQWLNISSEKIQPLPIEGNHISDFLDGYLRCNDQRDLFTDSEFFDACLHLSRICGTDSISPQILRVYGDYLRLVFTNNHKPAYPGYLTEIHRDLLKALNANQGKSAEDWKFLERILEGIAWRCVKNDLKAGAVARIDIYAEFSDEANLASIVEYLEKKLKLIFETNHEPRQIRFYLDPVAEYLAASNRVRVLGSNGEGWKRFLRDLRQKGSDATRSFSEALRDCCLVSGIGTEGGGIPEFVLTELEKCLDRSRQSLKKDRIYKRVNYLVGKLLTPETSDSAELLEELSEYTAWAGPVAPSLFRVFSDPRADLEVRNSALLALRLIGRDSSAVACLLIQWAVQSDEHLFFRSKVLSILKEFPSEDETVAISLVQILKNRNEYRFLRSAAAELLTGFKYSDRRIIIQLNELCSQESNGPLKQQLRKVRDHLQSLLPDAETPSNN